MPDASRYHVFDAVPWDYFNLEHINHFEETSLINLGLAHGFSMDVFLKTTVRFLELEQPMIFCAYRNCGKAKRKWQDYSKETIAEYIAGTQKNQQVNHVIDQLVSSGEEVVIWGAGNYTNRLLATTSLGKCNIILFVDKDKHKQGTSIMGKPICAPTDIFKSHTTATILVVAAVFHSEIVADIRDMRLGNKVVVLK